MLIFYGKIWGQKCAHTLTSYTTDLYNNCILVPFSSHLQKDFCSNFLHTFLGLKKLLHNTFFLFLLHPLSDYNFLLTLFFLDPCLAADLYEFRSVCLFVCLFISPSACLSVCNTLSSECPHYWPKCTCPARLQGSLIISASGRIQSIS